MENVPRELSELTEYRAAFKLDETYREWKIGALPIYIPHFTANVKAYIYSCRYIQNTYFEQIVKSCPKKWDLSLFWEDTEIPTVATT